MKLIFDSSTLIAFFTEINYPKLLFALKKFGYELYIPNGVIDELKKGITFNHLKPYLKEFQLLPEIDKTNLSNLKVRYPSLGKGELEVIYWTLELDDAVCCLDDGKARKVAKKLNLNLNGTLGILNELENKSTISQKEKKEIIRKLREAGFYLP